MTNLWRILSAFSGLLLLYQTALASIDNSRAGFPDGHVTAYEKAVAAPFAAFCGLAFLLAFYFLWVPFSKSGGVGRRLVAGYVMLVFAVILPTASVVYYYKYHQGLDTGTGG